jgi:SAM-dependent methyltransferase
LSASLPLKRAIAREGSKTSMGITSQLATLILREHRFRPITGKLLSIGRQTVYLTAEEAAALVEEELGISPRVSPSAIALDTSTRGAAGQPLISDVGFYSLFSDAAYRCLDVSAYEGADIVCNLCGNIPAELAESFDFIVNGSCLDNIFDPAAALRNLSRLLRPGGRIIHLERTSRRHFVYVAFALSWFHDYYALNDFEDCQVYLAQWDGELIFARWDLFHYQPVRELDGVLIYFGEDTSYFPWRDSLAFVIAERGPVSTSDKSPVQFEYRENVKLEGGRLLPQQWPADAADPYLAAAVRFHRSPRPSLLRPDERIELSAHLSNYAAEIVYRGSIASRHAGRQRT